MSASFIRNVSDAISEMFCSLTLLELHPFLGAMLLGIVLATFFAGVEGLT